jgi:enamine deaminase RidA (YjgF/YER057c/UK114 family)
MRNAIETGLPAATAPYSWAVYNDGILYTVHIPIRADGSIESGSPEAQTRQTLENLTRAVSAAGGTLDDVVQVTIYLTDRAAKPEVDRVYAEYFTKPYPQRACIFISGLALEETCIEIVAIAHVGSD